MTNTAKIFQALERLEIGQKTLQNTIDQQGKAITTLQNGQQALQNDVMYLHTIVNQQEKGIGTLQEGKRLLN
jgi:hypothetical protein